MKTLCRCALCFAYADVLLLSSTTESILLCPPHYTHCCLSLSLSLSRFIWLCFAAGDAVVVVADNGLSHTFNSMRALFDDCHAFNIFNATYTIQFNCKLLCGWKAKRKLYLQKFFFCFSIVSGVWFWFFSKFCFVQLVKYFRYLKKLFRKKNRWKLIE